MRKVLAVILSAIALTACSGNGSSGTSVDMTSAQTFDPDKLTVSVGETVTWTNGSSESHTVTAYEPPAGTEYFASGEASSEEAARDQVAEGLLDAGDTFEFTFDEPGTYRYFCIPHEDQGMVGTIVVSG
jgi:plastocyanin